MARSSQPPGTVKTRRPDAAPPGSLHASSSSVVVVGVSRSCASSAVVADASRSPVVVTVAARPSCASSVVRLRTASVSAAAPSATTAATIARSRALRRRSIFTNICGNDARFCESTQESTPPWYVPENHARAPSSSRRRRSAALPGPGPELAKNWPSLCSRCLPGKRKPRFAGASEVGGTGLEPVTPSLSKRGRRSLPFAHVRSNRMNPRFRGVASERERTRANARCGQSRHAARRGAPDNPLNEPGRAHREPRSLARTGACVAVGTLPPDGWAFHAAYRASGGFRADIVAYRDSIYEIEARKIADTYGQFCLASGGGPMRLQPGYQWGDIGDAPALAPLGPQS